MKLILEVNPSINSFKWSSFFFECLLAHLCCAHLKLSATDGLFEYLQKLKQQIELLNYICVILCQPVAAAVRMPI